MSIHEFEMNIDGETIRWAEKSHAQIFRNFWQFFMEKDLQKTIETIELAGIRTSESEYFAVKNGGKTKNIFIKENYYIHGHLNPQAMQKVYEKFIKVWEGNQSERLNIKQVETPENLKTAQKLGNNVEKSHFATSVQEDLQTNQISENNLIESHVVALVQEDLQTNQMSENNLKESHVVAPVQVGVQTMEKSETHTTKNQPLATIQANQDLHLEEPAVKSPEDTEEPLKILFGHSDESKEPLYWYPTTTSKIMHTNTGIIGTMGTGKTQFTKSFIKQIHDGTPSNVNGTPIDILIFDYKGDYIKEDFVEATNATVYQPYHLRYNPLALYRGKQVKPLLPLHTASTIKETIAAAFNLGIKQQQLLNDLIMEAYAHAGIHKADMTTWDLVPPTINTVFERLMAREEVKEDSLYAALKQIYDFEIFSPNSEDTKSLFDMIQGVTVINLAGYDQSVQNLIVGITLDTFYSQMSTKGHSTIQGDYRELTKMVLVDEADNFISQNFTSLKKIMKEGREYGVGVILSTQFLDHFATNDNDYAQYILTWIIHKVPTIKKKEVKAIFNPENQAEGEQIVNLIGRLQKHHSLVTSVTPNQYEVMEDMAFWKLLNN